MQEAASMPTPLSLQHQLTAPSVPSPEPCDEAYPELVGSLMYAMMCTRPDLAYPVSVLSRYVAPGRFTSHHWSAAKRVLRYLKGTQDYVLTLGGFSPVRLEGYSDSSYADDQSDRRSFQGYCFTLGSGVVSWRSTRSSSVSLSTCEAELYAGTMAAQEARWLSFLLAELGYPQPAPTLWCDNESTIHLTKDPVFHGCTKHIEARHYFLRELVQREQLKAEHIASDCNLADLFTKSLVRQDHYRLLSSMVQFQFYHFPPASPFTWLEELLITQCSELETLNDRIGDLLPCLRKLTIRECYYFAHLPESFTSLYHLEELFISTCNDFTLPTNFGHLPTLKLLVLESLSFTEFPPSFCHLTSLEALFLVDCHPLLNLPAGSCHLIALEALCFSRCEGLALLEDVGALARLESLRLHNCQHEPLPRSFTDLSSLTSLELSACFGGELPALGELSRLQELKIIDLPISMLPTSLTRLTGLQSLEVRGCQALSEVPPRLDMLVGLKRLVLTECEELGRPPAGLPPSLETLCLGPFVEGSSHVVDVSRLSQLRVLKLNCVGVRSAVNSNLACQEEQDEQVGQVGQEEWAGQVGQVGQGGQGEQGGQEGRGEHVEQGGQGKQGGKRGQGEQGGQGVQLHKLERLEMRLDSYIQELPIPLTFLPRLRSLLIDAPGVCSLLIDAPGVCSLLIDAPGVCSLLIDAPGVCSLLIDAPGVCSLLIDAPRVCSFPENMGAALPQLRQLELLSWSPEKLPGSIVHLRSLTSLMVEAPQLVSLPQGISCLSRLRRLELIRCIALQHSTELLLSQLASLQHLILDDAPGTPLPVTYVLLTDKP
ncbi:unnamed protein product [Closterium sp. NIES-54]